MKIPVQNIYYLLAYAWGYVDPAREREADAAQIEALPDLLAHVLAHRVSSLLKRGLERSYVEESLVTPGVRGKLEMAATIKQNLLSQAKTSCAIESFRQDILPNQILRATLRSLLKLPTLEGNVRSQVGLAYRKLEGIREIRLQRSSFRRVQLHRNNRPYRFLMRLCRLIHDSLLLDERGAARFSDIRDDRNAMAGLFERFVANFYEKEQARYRPGQKRMEWFGAESSTEAGLEHLPTMLPDVVLVSSDRRIILDTKYYEEALKEWPLGNRRIPSTNLYQMFAYLENRNSHFPEGPHHEGILLYPVVEHSFCFDYRLKGHRIQVRTVDLGQDWWKIRDDLLDLIGVRQDGCAADQAA